MDWADREICPFSLPEHPMRTAVPNSRKPGCESSLIAMRLQLSPSGGAYGWVRRS